MADTIHTLVLPEFGCPKCEAIVERANINRHIDGDYQYEIASIRDVVTDFLDGREECCNNCGRKLDWWKILRKSCTSESNSLEAFLLAGGQVTKVTFRLVAEREIVLHFASLGIPTESEIVGVNYYMHPPFGSDGLQRFLYPLEDNVSARGNKRKFSGSIRLWPQAALGETFKDEEAVPTEWTAELIWIPPSIVNDSCHLQLARSFFALHEQRLREVPFGAQAIVESAIRSLLAEICNPHTSKEKVREMLVKELTFNLQLNALYPVLIGIARLPPFPDEIRGCMNAFSTIRNKIAHDATSQESLNYAEVATGALACLFTFRHIQLVRSRLPIAVT